MACKGSGVQIPSAPPQVSGPPRHRPPWPISSSMTREGMAASSSQVAKVWRRSCGPTSTPLGPAKGARLDPGKPAASAGTITGWVDHQAAHHLRRPGPEPGDRPDPGSGRRHQPAGRAGGRRTGGPAWWAWAAPHPGGPSDRGQGLFQPGQPGGAAGPPHPPHHPRTRRPEGPPGPQGASGWAAAGL
jgi:hypothetical protein